MNITPSKAIERLKEEAKKNPTANAVFHVFALRKRSRYNLTLNGLRQKMRAEGFKYPDQAYRDLIKLLAELEFGVLDLNSKGKVRALKQIKVSLQSIGTAALSELDSSKLVNFMPKHAFKQISLKPTSITTKPVTKSSEITLRFLINGKPVEVLMPKELTNEEIAGLIESLKGKSA